MTYADLLAKLQTLTPAQLGQDVTVFDTDNEETYSLHDSDITGQEDEQTIRPESDVLDLGHFYLVRSF